MDGRPNRTNKATSVFKFPRRQVNVKSSQCLITVKRLKLSGYVTAFVKSSIMFVFSKLNIFSCLSPIKKDCSAAYGGQWCSVSTENNLSKAFRNKPTQTL